MRGRKGGRQEGEGGREGRRGKGGGGGGGGRSKGSGPDRYSEVQCQGFRVTS